MGTFGDSLREESLAEFIKSVIKKLETLQQGTLNKTQNDLRKACGLAKTLFDDIDTIDSKKFHEYMKKESSKLVAKQAGLKEKMKMMENEDPEIEEKAKNATVATVFDQGPVSTYKEARELDNKIAQVVCIYVALQIGAGHSDKKAETSQVATLAATFATLDQAIAAAGGEAFNCFPDELAELRKSIANPSEA